MESRKAGTGDAILCSAPQRVGCGLYAFSLLGSHCTLQKRYSRNRALRSCGDAGNRSFYRVWQRINPCAVRQSLHLCKQWAAAQEPQPTCQNKWVTRFSLPSQTQPHSCIHKFAQQDLDLTIDAAHTHIHLTPPAHTHTHTHTHTYTPHASRTHLLQGCLDGQS
eukprot:scaffold15405_cov22-Tisochrysis_lutea.AAC.2